LYLFTLKDGKLLILPTPPLFDAAARGTPWNFWMKLTPQKIEGTDSGYTDVDLYAWNME